MELQKWFQRQCGSEIEKIWRIKGIKVTDVIRDTTTGGNLREAVAGPGQVGGPGGFGSPLT